MELLVLPKPLSGSMAEQANERKDESVTLVEASAEDVRRVFGDYVSRAGYGNERIVIVRNGKRIAALVGIRDFERLDKSA